METRLDWDDYFLHLAEEVATRSVCLRRHVGAVAVDTKTNRILATGYNGNVPKLMHCTEFYCIRIKENIPSGQQLDRCFAVHAEQNIVISLGVDKLKDATIYVTNQPCLTCLKLLMSCGVKRIVWKHEYPDLIARALMIQYGTIEDKENFHQLIKRDEE